MPLEISEIGVHIAVGGATSPAVPKAGSNASAGTGAAMTQQQIEALVKASVQETLRNLRMREER
jgi:hypothetical protein